MTKLSVTFTTSIIMLILCTTITNANSKENPIVVVNICKLAPKVQSHDGSLYPGIAIDECERDYQTPTAIKNCIFKKGDNIDIAALYANGNYVNQDLHKSLAYACQTHPRRDTAIKALYEATQKGQLNKKFDVCDYSISSDETLSCSDRRTSIAIHEVDRDIKQLTSTFTKKQKIAYDRLQQSAFDYIEKNAAIDARKDSGEGTLTPMYERESALDQRKLFLKMISNLEKNNIKIPALNYINLNREMNDVYTQLMHYKDKEAEDYYKGLGNLFVRKKLIEATQKAFLTYRQNFTDFVATRYPSISTDKWNGWLTKIRIRQLKELFN